jgi:YidC/Oxa1 family membrane protein insertase
MLLYLMPIFFAISGVNFPIGVLLYWLTTNVWSMCQQFYVIRNMPAPGSQAEKAMQERRRKKGKPVQEFTVKGLDKTDEAEAPKPSGQRVQPTRNKKKKAGPAKPATATQPAGAAAEAAAPSAKPKGSKPKAAKAAGGSSSTRANANAKTTTDNRE